MSGFDRLPGRSHLAAGVRAVAWSVLAIVTSCTSPVDTPTPSFRVDPDTLDFGSLPVDSTRVLTFRLINTGRGTFPIHPQSSLPAFRVLDVDSTGIVVSPGQGMDVRVTFTPRRAGERVGSLVLEGSQGAEVFCSGWGEAAERVDCRVEPEGLEFGPVRPGEGVRRGFGVNNTGTAVLEGNVRVEGAGFTVVSGGGMFRLEPGQWHHVEVEFRPPADGEATCVVDLGIAGCPPVRGGGYGRGTWRVQEDGSGDAPTVQAAIDSSRDGDVVQVGPGRYYENLDLKGKKIHLLGEKGRDETILDGSRGESAVIVCRSGETNETVIEGFTITGGSGAKATKGNGRYGGGIYCESSSPVIRRNRVARNAAGTNSPAGGGGIHISLLARMEAVVIEECEIKLNSSAQNGGGIDIVHAESDAIGSVVIQDNVIEGSRTVADGGGIRIWGWFEGSITIRRNLILGNEAGDHGGGMYLSNLGGTAIEVSDNLIMGNLSRGHPVATECSGGGIWLSNYGARVHHNTIAFNRAERTNGTFYAVGGICELNPRETVAVEYNLVYRNQEGAFGVYGLANPGLQWRATFKRNLHYGNVLEEVLTGTHNPGAVEIVLSEDIIADPLFCVDGKESRGEVASLSPALNQPWGPIGAIRTGGCGPGLSEGNKPTWGAMNARYGPREPPNRPGGRSRPE